MLACMNDFCRSLPLPSTAQPACAPKLALGTGSVVQDSHLSNRQLAVPAQTLAYLLPTLSLAIARAEAEVEAAATAAATLSRRVMALCCGVGLLGQDQV